MPTAAITAAPLSYFRSAVHISYLCRFPVLHVVTFFHKYSLSFAQSLNFHLKVFHPQNCVYSIIADIKRQAQPQPQAQTQAQGQSQAVQGSSGVTELTTSSSTSGAGVSGANNAAGVLEGTDKAKLSAITNEWLASAELHLCTLQVGSE